MIRFSQVSKTFPAGNTVLENINFHVRPGQFVVITGHSGAGKTTLARLMIKDLEPSQGEIFIDDQNLSQVKSNQLPGLRQKIGVIFQDYKIIPDKTVAENLALALSIIDFPREQFDERINHLLELVEIVDKKDLFPIQLSGGELQRAAIARAVASEPQILFADEPTGNLDEATATEIMALLKKINRANATVLVATHNQSFVEEADRHIHLDHGKIVSDSDKGLKVSPPKHKKEAAEDDDKDQEEKAKIKHTKKEK